MLTGIGKWEWIKNNHRPIMLRMLAVLSVMVVSACGGGRIEVERITSLPPGVLKANFIILQSKEQTGAREFSEFADKIAGQLAAKGLTRVTEASAARYGVMFSYSGDGTRNDYGDARNGRRDRKEDDGDVVRTASIVLYDLTRPDRPDEKVFGAQAQCKVKTAAHDAVVLSALFDALLKDFPGAARETYSEPVPKTE